MFYVYKLIDPRYNSPFYVGKGSGDRCYVHLKEKWPRVENRKKYAYIQGLRNKGLEPIVEISIWGLSESDAYSVEAAMIKIYGRKDIDENGMLLNICSDNRPPKLSRSGQNNGRYGKPSKLRNKTLEEFYGVERAKEIRQKQSDAAKKRVRKSTLIPKPKKDKRPEVKIKIFKKKISDNTYQLLLFPWRMIKSSPQIREDIKRKRYPIDGKQLKLNFNAKMRRNSSGWKHAPETIELYKQQRKGKKRDLSPETRQKLAEFMRERNKTQGNPMTGRKGEKWPRYNKPVTEETRRKQSEAQRRRFQRERDE